VPAKKFILLGKGKKLLSNKGSGINHNKSVGGKREVPHIKKQRKKKTSSGGTILFVENRSRPMSSRGAWDCKEQTSRTKFDWRKGGKTKKKVLAARIRKKISTRDHTKNP